MSLAPTGAATSGAHDGDPGVSRACRGGAQAVRDVPSGVEVRVQPVATGRGHRARQLLEKRRYSLAANDMLAGTGSDQLGHEHGLIAVGPRNAAETYDTVSNFRWPRSQAKLGKYSMADWCRSRWACCWQAREQ